MAPVLAIADTTRFDRTFGRWSAFTATDPMTDEMWFAAVVQSGDGVSIQLSCHPHTPQAVGVSINTDEFLGTGFRNLMYRVDSGTANSILTRYGDKYVALSSSDDAQKMFLNILEGQKISLRLANYRYKSIDVSFTIEGVREAVNDLRAKCKSLSDRNTADSSAGKPNFARTPAPDGKALESTLKRLRSLQEQGQVSRGGTLGSRSDEGNALLSVQVRDAIGDHLRKCWTGDRRAPDFDKQTVRLLITTDAIGVTRVAQIAPSDSSRTSGVARAFAERVVRAALDSRCAELPLPEAMKGQSHTFEITYRP